MAITRPPFKNSFLNNNIPDWPCPSCKAGLLKGESKNFKTYESESSLSARQHGEWEPDWINGIFAGLLKCNNSNCKETVIVTGNMSVTVDHEYDEQHDGWDLVANEYLMPSCFVPPIKIFTINSDVPNIIQSEILNAFNIYWLDIASCANKIRIVVELIMDDMDIPKTYLDKKNKRRGYTLHQRIELFRLKDPDQAEHLMAIKWTGNSGSHRNEKLTRDDILDGFEILEHVTTKLYEKDSARIKKLTKAINKRKKPKGKYNPRHKKSKAKTT